ncbi:MAG: methyltransferase domain-containing protein [Devosia sp.]
MESDQPIRFEDGAAYEIFMGVWSREVGESFLDWLRPERGKSWLDVGCGNGAFTQLIVDRCAPSAVLGIDPSQGQITFAKTRGASPARFEVGDAMELPAADDSVDVAVSALVIFFMPDAARGVREMARVVRPGGIVATYAWDLMGGGFPHDALQVELRAVGHPPRSAPHPEAAQLDELARLWRDAGLADVETREITVSRQYDSYDAYWDTAVKSGGIGPTVAALTPAEREDLKRRVGERLAATASGPIAVSARANAVRGRAP